MNWPLYYNFYYAPGWWVVSYVLSLLGGFGMLFYTIIAVLCAVRVTQLLMREAISKYIVIPLSIITIAFAITGSGEPVITLGIIYVIRRIREEALFSGVLFGLVCFNPVVIIPAGLSILYLCPKGKRLAWVLGAGCGLFVMYGYFFFDLPAILDFITAGIMNAQVDPLYKYITPWHWTGFVYPWFYYCLFAVKNAYQKDIVKRKAMLHFLGRP